ncbi:MAG: hypothetical protein KKH28_03355 [Elusimicrobia bacterium]|nr:hypothetical protein [Elusimicrobiota bacterium]
MKKKKIFKIRFLGLVFFAFTLAPHPSPLLHAADTNVGTVGAAFLKIPAGSPRAQALGNCGVSVVEGSEAMTINPAGIASSQMREAGYSYLNWFADYSGQYVTYIHPVGQSVIGLNMAYYGLENFDVRDAEGKPQYAMDVKVRHAYTTLTLAKSFFLERLLAGVSFKGVLEDNYTAEYKNFVFDGGIIMKLGRRLSIGWAGQNFSGKKNQVVRIQRLGLGFVLSPFLTVIGEQKTYSDRKARLGGGVEFSLPEEVLQVGRVTFRAGYTGADSYGRNYDDKTLDSLGLTNVSGWTFGMGIYSAQAMGFGMALDYAMVPYGALGKSSQLMLKFQF